jgi:hypothetical protein
MSEYAQKGKGRCQIKRRDLLSGKLGLVKLASIER